MSFSSTTRRVGTPAHVEAGASGDFYGLDQYRLRVVRVSPAGKLVQAYRFPAEAKPQEFATARRRGRCTSSTDNTLHCVGFDGAVRDVEVAGRTGMERRRHRRGVLPRGDG